MESGFEEANSNNLPDVDHEMVDMFYRQNADFLIAGVKHVKTRRVGQKNYVDDAVGFVQLKRHYPFCSVKAKVTPEHKLRSKPYDVSINIDENLNEILECKCHDCAASEGGCKHAVALLYWLLKKSYHPSVTSAECYWKKSTLSRIGTVKASRISTISRREIAPLEQRNSDVLRRIISKGITKSCQGVLFSHYRTTETLSERISLHHLMIAFKSSKPVNSTADEFIQFCKGRMNPAVCEIAFSSTVNQSESSEWFAARFGRVTASKLYEAAHCETIEGTLTQSVLGASKFVQTESMKRGLRLESQVLHVVSETRAVVCRRSGIALISEFPIFGASPDAITDDFCIEIKCPSKADTVKNYALTGIVNKKPYAQIQLQMFLCGKQRGLFCVASPQFETDKKVDITEVQLDVKLVIQLMSQAESFWKKSIFPVLYNN